MSNSFEPLLPSDIGLLLRADAERCWLHREVIPVLQEVEAPEQLPQEEVDVALAYLEAMWNEATLRARETDAAYKRLCLRARECEVLASLAHRYHAAVQTLRRIVAERVVPFVNPALNLDQYDAMAKDDEVRIKDKRAGGCTWRVA